MNFKNLKVGKFCRVGIWIIVVCLGTTSLIAGCALSTGAQNSDSNYADVSLKSDRKEIAKLRAEIPKDRRKANDRLKNLLKFFGDVRLPPENIQEKYEEMFERERTEFDRKKERSRQKFDRKEQHERDAFERKLDEARHKFTRQHHTPGERSRFFERQANARENFNSDEMERRDDFDSAWRERTDDFDTDMHDKHQEFLEQYRDYSERYQAWKKSLHKKEHCRCDDGTSGDNYGN